MTFVPKFVEISENFSTDFHCIFIHSHIASKGLVLDLPALMENVIYRSHKISHNLRLPNGGKRHGKAEYWTVNTGYTALLYGFCLPFTLSCVSLIYSLPVKTAFIQHTPLEYRKEKNLCVRLQVERPSLNPVILTICPYFQDELSVIDNSCTSLVFISRVH